MINAMRKLPKTLDLTEMRSMVSHFAEMLTFLTIEPDVFESAQEIEEQGIEGLCLLGMGGSSIAGEYAKALLKGRATKPICIVKDYTIPSYITKDWAILAMSYSGNTIETLSALRQAEKKQSKILTITSGGQMKNECHNHPQILIQGGLQPRAAFPLLFSAALQVIETLMGFERTDFRNIVKRLNTAAADWGQWIPKPFDIAEKIDNRIPLFIGVQHMTPVCYRAKCQINENSKMMAFDSEIPEAAHNLIEGFSDRLHGRILPLFLRSKFEDACARDQTNAMTGLCNELEIENISLKAIGESEIESMLSMTHYLDMLSVELAEIHKIDSLNVGKITELKRRLSKKE